MKQKIKAISIILFTILLPFLIWLAKPVKYADILIFDKTVPNDSYREHKGLMWILNYEKYWDKNIKSPFVYNKNYYGFFPEPDKTYKINQIPGSLKKLDYIYITDSYGVYNNDFNSVDTGEHSSKIYGGLGEDEIDTLFSALKPGSVFIAEFNTFASPTNIQTRRKCEKIFGLKWTEWIGRYFQELSKDNDEIPPWLIKGYENQYKKKWEFSHDGFAFVNESERIVILTVKEHIKQDLLKVRFSKRAAEEFGITKAIPYYYWFDIVFPEKKSEVIAEYALDVNEIGYDILKTEGIPSIFPAVIRNKTNDITTYYFEGDYADNNNINTLWNFYGAAWLNGFNTPNEKNNHAYFFWKAYYPMMKAILKSRK